MKNTLEKLERLRAKKVIDSLFAKSCRAQVAYGFRFSWSFLSEPNPQHCAVLFISSKKKLKLAVDRNKRKRLLKELYRLNKSPLLEFLSAHQLSLALSINYVGGTPLNFHAHQVSFQKALQKIIIELQKHYTSTLHPAH
ncbi:MAG: ribonuclease P protein component [bacterium]|nr:ribonuclease P protein component [bacterium]